MDLEQPDSVVPGEEKFQKKLDYIFFVLVFVFRSEEHSPILSKSRAETSSDTMATTQNRRVLANVHNYGLSILCVFYGIGTWLPVNAVYSQMPIFVQIAPEGWSLPSYFSLSVQIANVAPFLYYLTHKKLEKAQSSLICLFLVIGSISMFALALTYHVTSVIFNARHSVCFFLFSFLLAMVGCTSSVLFLPFMNKLPELYLIPYFIGEGLSGLIPSAIALLQGVGKEAACVNVTRAEGVVSVQKYEQPLFDSSLFLMLNGGFMLLSTCSFFYLNYFSNFVVKSGEESSTKNHRTTYPENAETSGISKFLFSVLLLVQTLINCFANGVLPSIQSYSCLPYGTQAYHWSVNLDQIISPVVIYLAFFLPLKSLRVLAVCCVIQVISFVYEIVTALESPTPPLMGTTAGVLLIVSIIIASLCTQDAKWPQFEYK